ncbi:TM2 domain-containing protein [Arthrobacter sp. NPDC058130]|uniref:TM2 domain-containing protein n=1 Tax=Arthrobacter sp. NPDC058130 TaxID=3346353 RepID=UPI0036E43B56
MTQQHPEPKSGAAEPAFPVSPADGTVPPYAPPQPYAPADPYAPVDPIQYPPVAPPQYQGQYPVQYGNPQQPQPPMPPQPYPGQQYQGYLPATQPPYQMHYPQMSQQAPMPNLAYGYAQPKSRLVAGLLGIFLGGLGVHRFYLGYTTIGIIQILLTVFVGIFTFGLVALWGFVEGIMIFAGASYFRNDATGIPLRD